MTPCDLSAWFQREPDVNNRDFQAPMDRVRNPAAGADHGIRLQGVFGGRS